MKIAILFGDNDFHSCFKGVLTSLLEAYRYKGRLPEDKEKLCTIINEIAYGNYLLFQNQFEYNDEKDGIIPSYTKRYLEIDSEKILLNEEVTLYIKEVDPYGNGEVFILDTEIDYPGNSPVYSY